MKAKTAVFSKLTQFFLGLFLCSLIACGGGGESKKNDESKDSDNQESTEASDKSDSDKSSEDESGNDQNAASNEKSIDYKTLETYLPKSVKGYEAEGEAQGQQMSSPMGSYSQTEKVFKKGDDQITFVLGDYHLAGSQLDMVSAAWNMQFEDDNSKAGGITLKGGKVKGWEVLDKKQKNASITCIVGNRFLLAVNATNQKDGEFVKSTIESMNLDALIKMGKKK